MSDYFEDKLQEHRVIGIRHTLKAFKDDGLLDDDTFYPEEAADKIKDEILITARKWYRIGARRGARKTLDAFLNGDFEVNKNKKGELEIIANIDELSWKRGLNVTVGKQKKRIKKRKYKLTIKDLDFD